ncbi:hypothetical protein CCYA_CCYA10G2889 [Cyanidiococcus yangmingshanensis]|nr:hypothetical protein CCYA_CCYA10G2889 [Cyanidiococcus yangmingshanensis]
MQPDHKVGNVLPLQLQLRNVRRLAITWCQADSPPRTRNAERPTLESEGPTSTQQTSVTDQVEQLLSHGRLIEIDVFFRALQSAWRCLSDTERTARARRLRGWLPRLQGGAETLIAKFIWSLALVDEASARTLLLAAAHSDREDLASAVAWAAREANIDALGGGLPPRPTDDLILQGDQLALAYLRAVMTPSTSPKARRVFLHFGMPDTLAYPACYLSLRRGLEHCATEEMALIMERYPQPDEPPFLLCLARLEAFLRGAKPARLPSTLGGRTTFTTLSTDPTCKGPEHAASEMLLLLHEWFSIMNDGAVWSVPRTETDTQRIDAYSWHRPETRLLWSVRLLSAHSDEEHILTLTHGSVILDSLLERTRNLFPQSYSLYQTLKDMVELESDSETLARWLWSQESEQLPVSFICSYLFQVRRPVVQGAVALKLSRLNIRMRRRSRYPPETIYLVIAALLVTLRSSASVTPLNFRLLMDCLASFVQDRSAFFHVFLPFVRDTFGGSLQRADEEHLLGWHRLWIALLGRLAVRVPQAQRLLEMGFSRALERDSTDSAEECALFMRATCQLCTAVPARGVQMLAGLQTVIQRSQRTSAMDEAKIYALRALDALVRAELMEAPRTLRFLLQQMPLSAYERETWPAALADAWFDLLTSLLKQHPWQPARRARRLLPVLLWVIRDRESDPRAALALSRLSYRDWYAAQWWEWERAQRTRAVSAVVNSTNSEELDELLESLTRLMPNDQWSPFSLERFRRSLQRAAADLSARDEDLAPGTTPLMNESDAFYALARMLFHGAWAHRSRAAYTARRLHLARGLSEEAYHQKELELLREYANALPQTSPVRLTMSMILAMPEGAQLALVSAQLMATCGATLRSGLAYESLYALKDPRSSWDEVSGASRLAHLLCVWLLAPASNAPEPPTRSFWNRLELDFRPFQVVLQSEEEALLERVLRRVWMLPLWVRPIDRTSERATGAALSDRVDDLRIIMGHSWNVLSQQTWPWLLQLTASFYRTRWYPWLTTRGYGSSGRKHIYRQRLSVPEAAPAIIQSQLPFFSPASVAESLLQLRAIGAPLEQTLMYADRAVWSALLKRETIATEELPGQDESLLASESSHRLLAYWRALYLSECAQRRSDDSGMNDFPPNDLGPDEVIDEETDSDEESSCAVSSSRPSRSDPLCRHIAELIEQGYPWRIQRLLTLQHFLRNSPRRERCNAVDECSRSIGLLQAAIGLRAMSILPFLPPAEPTACFRRIHTIRFLTLRLLSQQHDTDIRMNGHEPSREGALIEMLCERIRLGLLST